MATLSCPRCSANIDLAERNTLALGPCFSCGGLWLSADASATVKSAMDAQASHAATAAEHQARRPAREGIKGGSALDCPVCRTQLERWPVGEVEVDHCPQHGTWYDRGELQDVQRHLVRRFLPPDAPLPGGIEDSGLELAREPTRGSRARSVFRGMVAAERELQGRKRGGGGEWDEGTGSFLNLFDGVFSGDDDDDAGWSWR
jgi:Zn-finger nucleic acid-binding protein